MKKASKIDKIDSPIEKTRWNWRPANMQIRDPGRSNIKHAFYPFKLHDIAWFVTQAQN